MSEIKFYWTSDEIYHSESLFPLYINILEDNRKILNELKNDLNEIIKSADIHPFTGKILLFKSQKNDLSGFASPFLNLINISNRVFKEKEKQNLLWLILHEKMHILEAEIISKVSIQENDKLNYFNKVIQRWLSESMDIYIEINSRVLDINNLYVYDYNDIAIDWEKKI